MQLRDYIKKVGAARFAEQTGLSIHTAYSYSKESGTKEPSPKTARLIEKATKGKVKMKDCYQPTEH